MKKLIGTFSLLALIALCVNAVQADLRLAHVFGDNMVLQREMPAPVWGWAEPGEDVSVAIAGQKLHGKAGADGRWMVKLSPMQPGGPHEMTMTGNNSITLKNVLVGDVWYCAGQSNIEMQVKQAMNADAEIAGAKHPEIRHMTLKKVSSLEPTVQDVDGKWTVCSPETAGSFSAAAYFFAHDLQAEIKVPVGVINSSWGGSQAEAWMDDATLRAIPEAKPIFDNWNRMMADWPKRKAAYDDAHAKWEQAAAKAKEEGKPFDAKEPQHRGMYPGHVYTPSGLFNGMARPVMPLAIRGVLWYQGESNRDRPYQYRKLFPAMIRNWRAAWGLGDFPFIFVQLPGFGQPRPDPEDSELAGLREAQTMTLAEPKTAMAITIDIGDAADIHPKNKQEVGRRLALAALAMAYGNDAEYSGPLFRKPSLEGDAIRIEFTHVAGGLAASDGKPLRGFAIAGDDRTFVWADAAIDGDAVIVRSAKVPHPAAVRYAWADTPDCNLAGKTGLPASPFRTDDWSPVPILDRAEVNRYNTKELRLFFQHVGEGGFVDQPLTGFTVAGEDRTFVPATAKLYFGTILVSSDAVEKPVAVRYAWPGTAEQGNLTAVTGVKVPPFRSDDWPEKQ